MNILLKQPSYENKNGPYLVLKKIEQGLILDRIFQVEPSISSDDIEAVNNYISSGSWITEIN